MDNSDVMRLWDDQPLTPEGVIRSCLGNISCTDDTPGLEWLTALIKDFPEGFKRHFSIGAVDVNTGEFTTFTQDNITINDAPTVAMASSSIPGWFQPRPFRGGLYMDGGTVYNTDATDGVKGCLDMGYAEEDIILDIAICGDSAVAPVEEVSKNALYNYMRGKDLHKSLISPNSISATKHAFPEVNYRYLFLEQAPGPSLDFRNQTTWPLQEQGRSLAA